MNQSFPLRYSIPALLLILGGTLACALIIEGVYSTSESIEMGARQQLQAVGDATVVQLEYAAAKGGADAGLWSSVLLKPEPQLHNGCVFDGANHPLAAGESKTAAAPNLALLNAARQSQAAKFELNPAGDVLAGAFPFYLPATNAATSAARAGVLYLEQDLRPQKDLQLVGNFRRTGMVGLLAFVLVVLAWAYLNRTLTHRIASLIMVTREIAGGDLARRSLLTGRDELAELGASFNQMAGQIQARTRALTESEEHHRRIVETAYEGIFTLDAEQRISFVNRRMAEMLGYTIDAMAGRSFEEFMFPEDSSDHQSRMLRRQFQEATRYERRLRQADGGELWIIMSATVLRDAAGNFDGAFGMATDITEHKRAEKKLLLQSSALMASANAIVITDPDGRVEWANPAFTRMTGYPLADALGQKVSFLKSGRHPPEFYANLWHTILQGKNWQGELTNRRRDGTLYQETMNIAPVRDEAGKILHFVAIKEDITEQRELELQLRQAQKMEAVSQLAGGVAHEFNNILTVVNGYAQLLKTSPHFVADEKEMVGEIADAAKRASALTRQLMLFSRQQPMKHQELNLNRILEDRLVALRQAMGDRVAVELQCDPTLPDLQLDPEAILQVVDNLSANAREAMPGGGRLTIGTQLIEVQPHNCERNPDAHCGRFACLSVADSGCGMDAAKLGRVFEPFFTTKSADKRTGFGLATVYGIVKQHKGWVEVTSQVGLGTTFKIFLPVLEAGALVSREAAPPALLPEPGAQPPLPTILLVEDDLAVRKMARVYLQRRGFRVLEAASGAAALEIWQKDSATIDLLFTDMVLPGDLNGLQLAGQLKVLRPDLRVLFCSGFSRDRAIPMPDWVSSENYLTKPFDLEMLVKTIRRILT